jgi:serine/threonine protein kinase/FixJ family two-component response regulator
MRLVNGRDTDVLPLAQPLTPREEEILNCLGDEMSNRQIAEHLTISLNTVKWYVRQIYSKLGVDNREEAVTRARSLGLLLPEEQGGPIRNNLPLASKPLTPREEEILSLIGQGKTNRQIAEELTVARNTVKWYVRQIYNKLGVNNREESADRARELGLLTEVVIFSQGLRGYEIRERLGTGRYGLVYRAYQTAVQREVAVKTILPRLANQPNFIRRFEFEARLVARLEHPNIVPLYDYWRDPSGAFLVMRWLRGGNLREALSSGPLSLETTSGLVEQITSALNFAHEQNVIHQDIRPANILLDEDHNAYVADFGIGLLVEQPGMPDRLENDYEYALSSPIEYSSPEQLRGTPPTPLSDIYNLGLVLYEMITGEHPFAALPPKEIRRRQLVDPLPLIHERRLDIPPAVDEVIRKATNKDPALRFQNALAFCTAFAEAVSGKKEQIPATVSRIGAKAVNPYKGLRPFIESDAVDFFGRDRLVQSLLARLAGGENERILAVVGPSGSGKSSVVRAGLIPALRSGALPGSADWFFIQMNPGRHPFEELEAALLRVAVNPPESLLDQLHEDNHGLNRSLLSCLPDENGNLFLLIDQFEELFTLVEEEAVRQKFLDMLAEAVDDVDGRLTLAITLRADFYDRPLKYAQFGQLIGGHTEAVLPLSAAELEEAIVQPAEEAGAYFEEGLAARIIDDVRHQPGALPLLQYALTELYDNRDGQALTHAAYEEIGGVTGALAQSAEALYLAQNPQV